MTGKPLGAAFVMNDGKMIGLICEGDIRRALQSGKSLEELTASDMMSRQPITVFEDLNFARGTAIDGRSTASVECVAGTLKRRKLIRVISFA